MVTVASTGCGRLQQPNTKQPNIMNQPKGIMHNANATGRYVSDKRSHHFWFMLDFSAANHNLNYIALASQRYSTEIYFIIPTCYYRAGKLFVCNENENEIEK